MAIYRSSGGNAFLLGDMCEDPINLLLLATLLKDT